MSTKPLHLVQLNGPDGRRIAVVDEPNLRLLATPLSVYALVQQAIEQKTSLSGLVRQNLSGDTIPYDSVYNGLSGDTIPYDSVYNGQSEWQLLPPIDVPNEAQRVLVTGTGLTHYGSARDRQNMHLNTLTPDQEASMTDSMRMFEWGRQRGRPEAGAIGIAPEWFYKGSGAVLRAHNEPLEIPGYAEEGGEEAEIAAVYVISSHGVPHRVGMCNGNEFSDHLFERRNYLNLAGSKLRTCSLGPELVVDPNFHDVPGTVRILRKGSTLWHKDIRTGEENMCHSLANLEHHHFKFEDHRQPGQVHVHFMGADTLSFGEQVHLDPGDVTEVQFEGFGRALRNTILTQPPLTTPVRVETMQ
jgi:hypothetical protein